MNQYEETVAQLPVLNDLAKRTNERNEACAALISSEIKRFELEKQIRDLKGCLLFIKNTKGSPPFEVARIAATKTLERLK
jgi:hypothetical protein